MSRLVITSATEAAVLDLMEELESLIEADEGTVFLWQHIEAVAEIKERFESSDRIEGDYYEC